MDITHQTLSVAAVRIDEGLQLLGRHRLEGCHGHRVWGGGHRHESGSMSMGGNQREVAYLCFALCPWVRATQAVEPRHVTLYARLLLAGSKSLHQSRTLERRTLKQRTLHRRSETIRDDMRRYEAQ